MPRKKAPEIKKTVDPNVVGLKAEVISQPITETLEQNYMPYAMSVIVSRAIPEIDGFKPSHRKLLYTMYKMNLLTGGRTKSANIVGQTMRLNPHGDAAIYETMVRLSKGYGALLTPFVDSKGNFGKVFSRDMSYAASRYTEAKLAPICAELFGDIDSDTVDFVDNYDGSMKEPALLPTRFPNVLVSANLGIAVGMASQICGFNLEEVCRTTIAYLEDPNYDLLSTLPAPDFPTGGEILYDRDEMAQIYRTGRGSVKVRARWRHLPKENIIEIYEIPYSTTVEAVIDKVAELVKAGKLREVADMRDETDLSGLKLAIDLKRGADPEQVMQKLFRLTPLCDSFACNFNILIAGNPRVMGVGEILDEWIAWRMECIRRRVFFDLQKKRAKLHLLQGLGKILLDIDRAIAIIRNTEREPTWCRTSWRALISTRCRQTSWPRSSCATSTASTSSSARPRPTRWKKTLPTLRRRSRASAASAASSSASSRRSSASTRRRGARASSRRSPWRRCRPRILCRIIRCSCSSLARAISRRSRRSRCA